MPLPPELDLKIRNRFDELIQEGNHLNREGGSSADYEAFFTKCLSLTNTVLGGSERGLKIEKRINHHLVQWIPSAALVYIKGILQGLKDDYESGFLDNLEERIVANISADYMTQVDGLLDEGQPGQYDHVPAAVLCGAVLEDAMRRLCDRQAPQVPTDKPNGRPKALNALIQDLQKANAFNKLKAQQLRGWAQVRNSAAHGEFTEFNRSDVEQMVNGVRNFLADYL